MKSSSQERQHVLIIPGSLLATRPHADLGCSAVTDEVDGDLAQDSQVASCEEAEAAEDRSEVRNVLLVAFGALQRSSSFLRALRRISRSHACHSGRSASYRPRACRY